MPARLQINIGDHLFEATVSADGVRLTPEGPIVPVTRAGDRWQAGVDAGVRTGAAVVAGDRVWVSIAGDVFEAEVSRGGRRTRSTASEADAFTPPMPATVVRIAVAAGDTVRDGDVLIALEAMKMELPMRAPRDGVVRAVHCREGDLVQPDQVLLELE